MKLRYFLRGIGMGVILTTIILTVSHCSNRKMSDNEIIERARELGMVFSLQGGTVTDDGPSGSGETVPEPETTKGTEPSAPEETVPEQTSSEEPTTKALDDAQTSTPEAPVTTPPATTDAPATQPPATTEALTTTPPETEAPTTQSPPETAATGQTGTESEETAGDVITYTLTISGGMSSNMVCSILRENGIIADAADFDRFLIGNGYAERIRVGSFEVRSSMSYEELAAAFCSR